MPSPEQILEKYWGYDSFRPRQREIIESILQGHDTLGLLPTGGGKSITFQVPALILPGLTIVVTPLISLMKDQVDNLRERGIRGVALHSALSRAEHRLGMDRCRLGKAKLLYLSPEKLQSDTFISQLSSMNVSLIVVDEAHCISQWGYDFRPSYLKIAKLRRLFPTAPVLALTASATPEVAEDIMTQLEFGAPNVFARSFARDNLSYLVRYADHKESVLLRVLKTTAGSAIVYVRSRKRTREIAQLLQNEGLSADFYHAGLAAEEKNDKQNAWRSDKTRIMVATNAFGMGIDKPDVRVVVHMDLPMGLEEYYQEAGRAGRDGKPSYAVVVASNFDKGSLTKRLNDSFPPKDYIKKVYELACNFLNIAVGSGYGAVCEFNFPMFCERFALRPMPARSALHILSQAGYMDFVEEVDTRSRVMMQVDKSELYSLNLDADADAVLQHILRSYTGLFADYVNISESLIAYRAGMDEERVYKGLLALSREGVLNYVPRSTTPYIMFTTSREEPKHLLLPKSVYEDQRERLKHRVESMKQFVFGNGGCRVNLMLRYFGEQPGAECGLCDYCRSRKKAGKVPVDLEEQLLRLASQPGGHSVEYMARQLGVSPERLVEPLRKLMSRGCVTVRGLVVTAVSHI